MNINDHDSDEDLFGNDRYPKNQYSTFIQQLQESTEKLMQEVFNTQYYPQVQLSGLKESKIKQKSRINGKQAKKPAKTNQNFYTPRIDREEGEFELDQSFKKFLFRNQRFLEQRKLWIKKQQQKKQQHQMKSMKQIPDILRGSRQRMEPIYQRCIDMQKEKMHKLESKRIQQKRQEAAKISEIPFNPTVHHNPKKRTFDQYLKDKEKWQKNKKEHIQTKKIILQSKKYMECSFTPNLISKYPKQNPRIIKGEKVEERLLRSLQKLPQNMQKPKGNH